MLLKSGLTELGKKKMSEQSLVCAGEREIRDIEAQWCGGCGSMVASDKGACPC